MEKGKKLSKATSTIGISIAFKNSQPRVVLERLTRGSGDVVSVKVEPSTSGSVNRKRSLNQTRENELRKKLRVTEENDNKVPALDKPGTSKNKKVVQFKVAQLEETYPPSPDDDDSDSDSECSFHNTPKEIILLDGDSNDGSNNDCQNDSSEDSVSERIIIEENDDDQEAYAPDRAADDDVYEAHEEFDFSELLNMDDPNFHEDKYRALFDELDLSDEKSAVLSLLINLYIRRSRKINKSKRAAIKRMRLEGKHRIIGTVSPIMQTHNHIDCVVKTWLPINGEQKRKRFSVKLSQLIALLKRPDHPLHKFHQTLTLQNMKYLKPEEVPVMARILSDFVCAQPVTT